MESEQIEALPRENEYTDHDDEPTEREMSCPVCGHSMPDLKGGKATICPVCGFKDSCCY